MRTLVITSSFVLFLFALGCAPEFQEKEADGGWISYAVGTCETQEGREPERACTEAKQCSYYCCECESGTQYIAALCTSEQLCADFGAACREAESDACK